MERIQGDNEGIINRMINQSSIVPPLAEMKKEFKQSKRYARMVRKLPAILKHEEQFRHDMSIKRLNNSKTSLSNYKKGSVTSRSSSQQMNFIEKELTAKADA
jgi:arginine/lysine/ornithine decarboxylase